MSDKILKHHHLLVQAHVKNPIKDVDFAKQWLSELVIKVGMVIAAGPIASYVETPGNRGITAAINLQTSHASVHGWDEVEPALVQFDIYSCAPVDLDIVWEHFSVLEPISLSYKFLDRDGGFRTMEEGTKTFK
jgi:S-adenosylmethionine/arginine decarboxylase-like enzyme